MKHISTLKKVIVFLSGILAIEAIDYIYSYLIYPIFLYLFGVVYGTIYLFFIALATNYIQVLAYDKFKVDIFQFEKMKEIKNAVDHHQPKTLMQKMILMGHLPGLLFLCFYDPFMAVIYYRKSTKFDGLKRRDYINLILYTFISCILWSVLYSVGYEIFVYIRNNFF